jgi:acyl CoA:acetate/3-ketoacid CoA transferase beta subunit
VDVGFLGAAQVDRFGNLNSTVIGDYEHRPRACPARVARRRSRRTRAKPS